MSYGHAIKRFSDINTDSDFEFDDVPTHDPPPRKLSAKPFRTSGSRSSSIAFESDCDGSTAPRVSAPLQHKVELPAPPEVNEKPQPLKASAVEDTPTVTPSTQVAEKKQPHADEEPVKEENPSERVEPVEPESLLANLQEPAVVPVTSSKVHSDNSMKVERALPTERVLQNDDDVAELPSPPAVAAGGASPALWREESREGSDTFAREMLPYAPTSSTPTPALTSRTVADDNVDAVLARAKQRLEEHQRFPSPQRTPTVTKTGVSFSHLANSPTRPWTVAPSVAAPVHSQLHSQRVATENTRLQNEVVFLSRENQKLRSANAAASSAEVARLQLTVEALRREFGEQQESHATALREMQSRLRQQQRDGETLAEEAEAQAAAASQYRQLYDTKQSEAQTAAAHLAAVAQQVAAVERRQELQAERYASALQEAEARAVAAEALVSESRAQRQELQGLCTRLRQEAEEARLSHQRARAEREGTQATQARRIEALQTQVAAQQEEEARLRSLLASRESAAQVAAREGAQALSQAQRRHAAECEELQAQWEGRLQTIEASKRLVERNVASEQKKRQQLEQQLREMMSKSEESLRVLRDQIEREMESGTKQHREELGRMREAREAAETASAQAVAELANAQESLAYYQNEFKAVSVTAAHSERLRERDGTKYAQLSAALEEMTYRNEELTAQLRNAQQSLEEARVALGSLPVQGSSPTQIAYHVEQLSDENERLTGECTRIAEERDVLIAENGRIAEELLKWKTEMRQLVLSRDALSAKR